MQWILHCPVKAFFENSHKFHKKIQNQRTSTISSKWILSKNKKSTTTVKVMNFSWNLFFFCLVSDFSRRWMIPRTKSWQRTKREQKKKRSALVSVITSSSITSWKAYTCKLSIAPHKLKSAEEKRINFSEIQGLLPLIFRVRVTRILCQETHKSMHDWKKEFPWKLEQHNIPKHKKRISLAINLSLETDTREFL